MAQLKDLLVSGAARFLNGIFVLGTSSMNDTNPAETETYSLGTNNLKWKNIYGKDGYIANIHATNLYDAGGTTTVADKYISTLAVKTTNGTTFTFKGVDGAGGENSAITVPNHANNIAGLVTSDTQTIYGAKTFNSIITASSSTPIQFTATGTGTYNKAIFYSDSNGVTFEVQRASDSSSATALPFLIKSRGGQWNTLKSGPVYINGTSTFGNAGQPIYWNSGIPTAIDWHVGNGSLGEHNANNITYNMIGYYNSNGPSGLGEQSTDGAIYAQAYNSNWVGQIAQDYKTGNLFVRGKNNGSWTAWKSVGGGGAIFTYSSSILYDNAKNRFYTNKTDSSWNAQVYSNYGIKDGCSMSFIIDQTTAYIMVGLNTDPKTDASYSSIDYCWYPQSGGALCIYESGNSINCPSGHTTYAAGDEFSIEYVAGFIRYYHNGILCRQVARAVGSPLYFDSSFHNAGSISAVEFKKITDGENYLQDFHNNYDISTTETVDTKSYLFTAGNTGGWCTTSVKPSGVDNAFGILHAHLHNGNYAMQLGFGGTTDRLYYRNAYATTTWTAWQTLHDSHHDIIPNADLTRNIGSASYKFNNAYLYTLHLRGASSATMTNGTAPANPKIIFSENGGQQVGIVYTDHDAYRASKGLKVMGTDGSDEGNVWLEVQGNIYTGGTTYLNGQNANRLVWTDTNKALIAGYHYAASDRIAINYAGNTGYNFYVNGTSYFNGNVTHNGITYFANGTTYSINNSADATLRRGIFRGTSNSNTATGNYFNTGALEVRESNCVGSVQSAFAYAPRIGFHWGNRIAASLSFHSDGIFYFRKQNGTDRAVVDCLATRIYDSNNGNAINVTYSKAGQSSTSWLASWNGYEIGAISPANITAGKATQLATARNIALSGNLQGSASFNGAGDATITALNYQSSIGGGNTYNYPWHRIATTTIGTGQYNDKSALLRIRHPFNGGGEGLVKVSARTNSTGSGCDISAIWLYRYNIAANNIGIGLWGVTGDNVYLDVYYKCAYGWPRAIVELISNGRIFTLISSNEANDTTTTDKKTSSEVYTSIENGATLIRGKAYTKIVYGSDGASNDRYVLKAGDTMTGALQTPNLYVINDSSNSAYDALAYFRNYSSSDWSVVIDKNNSYDYGLDVRTSTNSAMGIRSNGQMIINSTCGSYREGIRLKGADGTWNTIILGATADSGTNTNAWSIHRKADNNFAISRNSSDGVNGLVLTTGARMGIGTASPAYKIHATGDIYADGGWLRTNGARGWYNESYSGGMYMTDSNFVRNYNSKALSININSNNAWGIGSHRLAAVFKGNNHVSILLSTDSLGYGLCVNNDGNWYWGKRTTNSETSTSGDNYILYGSTSHMSPYSTNAMDLGLSSHRWRSGHIYRDFNIYGNESTGDESHIRFNASDNTQRAIITFNGNVDNTFKSSTHLKIATSYGDIRLSPANGNVNIGDGNCSLTWRKADNGGITGGLESGVYFSTPGRESVVFANMYAHTGWIFVNGIRPSNKTNWNSLGVTPAVQIHHNALYINRPIRDADTADYNLYVNGSGYINGRLDACNRSNSASYIESAIQIRERGFGGTQDDTWATAPRLSWHWAGRVQTQIGLASNGELYLSKNQFANAYKLVYETGTWGINISGNATTATQLSANSRMDYGWNGLNYFNISGPVGSAAKANNTPTNAWWHILRFNHANNAGYYTDLAVPFNANSLYYKRVANGALQNGGWVQVADSLNIASMVNNATLYWANIRISSTSNSATSPTFANTFIYAADTTERYLKVYNSTGSVYVDAANGRMGLWTSVGGTSNWLISTTATAAEIPRILQISQNSNTVTIGSQNANWCHIYNSANIPFIFNNQVYATNAFRIYNGGSNQSIFGNGYVELYGSTPFIDFHRNNDTGDFSHRIIDNHIDGIDIQRGGGSSGNNWLYITSSSATTTAGIYFTQQGGGWYMKDSTYIRNYNSKPVYITGRLGVNCELRMWARDNQITKDGLSVSWVNGRNSAIIRETTAEGWHAVVSAKTKNGSWEIGEYTSWANKLIFSYVKDSDYSSGNNTSTIPFSISPTRGIEISTLNYGTSVPSSGETGQIFFKI